MQSARDQSKEFKKSRLLRYKAFSQETGRPNTKKFKEVNLLFDKSRQLKKLGVLLRACAKCTDLNVPGVTESALGYGNPNSQVFFVGQSLCTLCMATQIPFTMGSGYAIDAALALSGLTRRDVFMSSVVHCHPLKNRSSSSREIKNCLLFLYKEIEIVKPEIIICLGADAARVMKKQIQYIKTDAEVVNVKHPASFLYSNGPGVFDWIVNLSMEMYKWI
ncbi:MAG: hypothetical protein FVQ80_11535 [Planctomycetes bacterium]|nr:hypothetical protein [Planctomycetota bacterium]